MVTVIVNEPVADPPTTAYHSKTAWLTDPPTLTAARCCQVREAPLIELTVGVPLPPSLMLTSTIMRSFAWHVNEPVVMVLEEVELPNASQVVSSARAGLLVTVTLVVPVLARLFASPG